MKIIRFKERGRVSWGVIKDEFVVPLKTAPFSRILFDFNKIPLRKVKLELPVLPSKIVCVGLNYRDHAKELNMSIPKTPIIFIKPVSSLIGDKGLIEYPSSVKQLDYEAELAVVIGKRCKNIREVDARKYILGYTCLNDVTARDIQKAEGQWTRAKSFDTFCPVGPWIETERPSTMAKIKLYLNNKIKQDSDISQMIFPIDALISFVSKTMTLFPGDVVSTGTPCGIGPMRHGDIVEVDIEGVGKLKNTVV
ncbi:MAG: fumarylacetoacetate hydrolase family protein [Candidatus Omnitrophota bacterium]